ncbi:hypothetical protein BCR32DRAFT_329279 [Anaeromyces robustus]|jgi:hypothetical protein|uniref:Ser-Thr-rich glycosyl-phosphatidyl-inositol-anchored membrane family-domain-containing protein n=1 Tax=Anaeromyces robustus TaxID=1754192 RepID=A0A1Y1WSW9_9FUNG|nr:hypothetical protein BCR32DRAFT_329279 [Anaeromyces robustus]|eukprot:ORX76627.1 hypothetical protein BCR32DRAFT_329279 [Anaeromyces robustus]
MKCVLLLTIVFAFVAYVQAGIKIVDPLASTTWALGSSHTVKWQKDTGNAQNTSPESGSQPLEILHYSPGEQTSKLVVYTAQIPDVSANSFTVDLTNADKSKFPSTGDYSICIGGVANGSFSARFKITGGTGTASSGSAGTGGSAAPVAGATTSRLGAATTGLGAKATTSAMLKATTTKKIAATSSNTSDAKTLSVSMTLMAIVAAAIAVFM